MGNFGTQNYYFWTFFEIFSLSFTKIVLDDRYQKLVCRGCFGFWRNFKTFELYDPFLWMGFNCLKARATSRRQFTFFLLSSQKFLVLILSTLEGWKAESTLEPPSDSMGPLDWESIALTTRSLLHKTSFSRCWNWAWCHPFPKLGGPKDFGIDFKRRELMKLQTKVWT